MQGTLHSRVSQAGPLQAAVAADEQGTKAENTEEIDTRESSLEEQVAPVRFVFRCTTIGT